MLYYGEYSNGRRYVRAYDEEKNGAPRIVGKLAFLYHGAVSVSAGNIFATEKSALASWGKYSRTPVAMPDGAEAIPAQYFGTDTPESVFIPCGMVRGELWPREYKTAVNAIIKPVTRF